MAKASNHNIVCCAFNSLIQAWRFSRCFCSAWWIVSWAWRISRLACWIYFCWINKSIMTLRYRVIQSNVSILIKSLLGPLRFSGRIIITWCSQLGFFAKSGFGTKKNKCRGQYNKPVQGIKTKSIMLTQERSSVEASVWSMNSRRMNGRFPDNSNQTD